jgi:hypothetical protein
MLELTRFMPARDAASIPLALAIMVLPAAGCVFRSGLEINVCHGGGCSAARDETGRSTFYGVRGRVTGIAGGEVALTLNGSESLSLTADGDFAFVSQLATEAPYEVRVAQVSTGLACTLSGGSGVIAATDVTGVVVQCTAITVAPLYPHAADWLDFIKNDGTSIYTASSTACDLALSPAPRGYRECLNGGQLRLLALPAETSCAGLSASDSAGVFDWRCDASTGTVRFLSFMLREGKGLADLIEPTGEARFRALSVIVQHDTDVVAVSAPSVWWNNPVVDASSNGVALSTAKTVYVARADWAAPDIIDVWARQVAFVGLKEATISRADALPTDTFRAVLRACNVDQVWIEGRFDVTGTGGVSLCSGRFDTVLNMTTVGVNMTGALEVDSVSSSRIENVNVTGNASATSIGINLDDSHGNHFKRIACALGTMCIWLGTYGGDTRNNLFEDVVVSNGANYNINAAATSHDNRVIGFTSMATKTAMEVGAGSVVIGATAINSSDNAFYVARGAATLMDVAVINGTSTGQAGVFINGVNDCNLVNIAAGNVSRGLVFNNSANNYVAGVLTLGANSVAACEVTGGGDPGLQAGTCQNTGISQVTALTTTATLSASIVGKVTSDAANPAGSTGSASFASIDDWTTFAVRHRAFGHDGGDFPSADNEGPCAAGDICRIWDASPRAGDTWLRAVLAVPTGDDYVVHRWAAADAAACSEIAGATWGPGVCSHPGYMTQATCEAAAGNWTTNKCSSLFLRDAVEVTDDLVGNDNGLCESGEVCLFTPNIGSYQGHGTLANLGPIVNGVLHDITLVRYASNGY